MTARTQTNFTLPATAEKPSYVQNLFKRVASYYDLMNDLMTLGMHRLWKQEACKQLKLPPKAIVIDLCCGTGDLEFVLNQQYPDAKITGLDFCPEMLEVAHKRASKKQLNAQFIQGDAMNLPFNDQQFDGAIISYGLRNVSDYTKCLEEMVRVVKPGGRVVVLDMSHPVGFANILSAFYRFTVLPLMGKIIANDSDAYRYLANSIFFYPTQDKLVSLMTQVGLEQVAYKNKMGGVCALHWGQKH